MTNVKLRGSYERTEFLTQKYYPKNGENVGHVCYDHDMSKSQKRPQAQKEYVDHVQNLRRGSTTSRHKSVRDYQRKPKHVAKGWE